MSARGHLSLRPQMSTLERLDRRSRQVAQAKTSLAERYVAEGLDMDEFPGIQFVDGPLGRRPALMGTGLDVWEVVATLRNHGGAIAEAAAYLRIDPALVERSARYYGEHREEVDGWIARVQEIAEQEERRWLRAREALDEASPR